MEWSEYALIAFGAMLGAMSTVATTLSIQWWNGRKKKHRISNAVAREWHEVGHRLLVTALRIELDAGTIDRQFLEWALPLIEKYEGPNPTDGLLKGVAEIAKKDEVEIKAYAAAAKLDAPDFQSVPRIEAPYTEQVAASYAQDLSSLYVTKLFDLVAQLGIFNALNEDSRYWNQLTFTTGISDGNLAAAETNAAVALRGLSERARILIKRIGALEAE